MRRLVWLMVVLLSLSVVVWLAGCGGSGEVAGGGVETAGKPPPATFSNPAMVFHRAPSMGLKYAITLGRWGPTGAFETLAITSPGAEDDAHPVWNPLDSTRIAFYRGGGQQHLWDIYTVDPDGKNLKLEYPRSGPYRAGAAGNNSDLRWFPEGDRLVFVGGPGVVVLDLTKPGNIKRAVLGKEVGTIVYVGRE